METSLMIMKISKKVLIIGLMILTCTLVFEAVVPNAQKDRVLGKEEIQTYFAEHFDSFNQLAEVIWKEYEQFAKYESDDCKGNTFELFHYNHEFSKFESLLDDNTLSFFRSMIDDLHPEYIVLIDPIYFAEGDMQAPSVAIMFNCNDDRDRAIVYAFIKPKENLSQPDEANAIEYQASFMHWGLIGEAAKKTEYRYWWIVD